ncbi:hypothetical protein FH972_022151 [Carpinus fangiana]|uniref:Potassium transport protein n=1 Tax=Carpinus fangiana TaxID=176857 RepID=A0A5N6KRS2_9ROSI|nr:hypothetical protein FH972_022151 [Carpinus fangiana]
MAARERRPSGDSQKSMDSCPRRPRSAAAEWLRTQALLTPIRKIIRLLLRFLPERNFITVHYAYFIFTCLLSAVIFWGSSTSAPVSFIDALFLCSSAMTEAGLNTVNLSRLNTWQQFMLMGLIIIGSAIWVSAFVVFARLQAFQHNFADVIKRRQQTARSRRQQNSSRTGSLVSGQKLTMLPLSTKDLSGTSSPLDDASGSDAAGDKQAASPRTHVNQDLAGLDLRRVSFGWSKDSDGGRPYLKDLIDSNLESGVSSLHHARPSSSSSRRVQQSHRTKQHSVFSFTGIGAIATSNLRPRSSAKRRSSPYAETNSIPLNAERTSAWFPSKAGYFMRNSQVHGLSAGERRELGGREYSAVKFLSVIVPVYFILMQLLGSIGLAAWVAYHRPDTARANGMNPWWVGAFNGISAFNNSGMSLLDANMVAFQDSVYMLCTMGFLILAGNTAYPCFLRLIIWTMWKLLPANDDAWADERANLRFLLDHPRRCYTNLFPARHTWWLAGAVVVLNSIDWAAFELLNIGNDKITSLPNGTEVLAGLFQALAVRSGGFYVVPITSTRVSLQVLAGDAELLGAVGVLGLGLHLDANNLDRLCRKSAREQGSDKHRETYLVPRTQTTTKTTGQDLLRDTQLIVLALAGEALDGVLGDSAQPETRAPVGDLAHGNSVDALVDAADALGAVNGHEGLDGAWGLHAGGGDLVLCDLDGLHAGAEAHGRVGLRQAADHATCDAADEGGGAEGACVVLGLGGDEEQHGAFGGGFDPGPGDETLVDCGDRVLARPEPSSKLLNLTGFFSRGWEPWGAAAADILRRSEAVEGPDQGNADASSLEVGSVEEATGTGLSKQGVNNLCKETKLNSSLAVIQYGQRAYQELWIELLHNNQDLSEE